MMHPSAASGGCAILYVLSLLVLCSAGLESRLAELSARSSHSEGLVLPDHLNVISRKRLKSSAGRSPRKLEKKVLAFFFPQFHEVGPVYSAMSDIPARSTYRLKLTSERKLYVSRSKRTQRHGERDSPTLPMLRRLEKTL